MSEDIRFFYAGVSRKARRRRNHFSLTCVDKNNCKKIFFHVVLYQIFYIFVLRFVFD